MRSYEAGDLGKTICIHLEKGEAILESIEKAITQYGIRNGMACIRELALDPALVNPNGSGIALGHPLGATGAIITVKLLYEMARRKARYGLASLCIGGGQGMGLLQETR